jgi:hypothetical protein
MCTREVNIGLLDSSWLWKATVEKFAWFLLFLFNKTRCTKAGLDTSAAAHAKSLAALQGFSTS